MNLVSTSSVSNYWKKFPSSLRLIIKARFWTAIGAGGVLYLSPIIFNRLGFSAEQIGCGITTAAFAGITTRLGTGYCLDNRYSYTKAIKVACLIAIISDLILFYSQNYWAFISGQFFLGAAAGIYWPSVELAVPLNCNNRIKSDEGYALARSADAIGVTLGVLIGTFGTYFKLSRIIYLVDIVCMIYIFNILISKIKILSTNEEIKSPISINSTYKKQLFFSEFTWIFDLFPLLLLTLFVTGAMNLLQSFLPLDLARGGIIRPPLIEEKVATLLAFKLILVSIFQWPVGYLIRSKDSSFKFRFCLISLLTGFMSLSLSNLLVNGNLLIILAFIPLTIALCIFLPSASDAIIKTSPIKYRGSAIALYSQCFGISALAIPWLAGRTMDHYNTAFQVWLVLSLTCIFLIPICKSIK